MQIIVLLAGWLMLVMGWVYLYRFTHAQRMHKDHRNLRLWDWVDYYESQQYEYARKSATTFFLACVLFIIAFIM